METGIIIVSSKKLKVPKLQFIFYRQTITKNFTCNEGFKGTFERHPIIEDGESFLNCYWCDNLYEFSDTSEYLGLLDIEEELDIDKLGITNHRFSSIYKVDSKKVDNIYYLSKTEVCEDVLRGYL